jgi:hypothetical protein
MEVINLNFSKDLNQDQDNNYTLYSIDFANDNNILINIGHTLYRSTISKNSTLDKYDYNKYKKNYEHFLPVTFDDNNQITLSYYNKFNLFENTVKFILQDNNSSKNLGYVEDCICLTNSFYSIRHNSIFQIVTDYEGSKLIRTKLGDSLKNSKSFCKKLVTYYQTPSIICSVPYQDFILVTQNKRVDCLDIYGKITKSFEVEDIHHIENICCTEDTIIIIGLFINDDHSNDHYYLSKKIYQYIALFYNLESLTKIDMTFIDEDVKNNRHELNYSYGHDVAVLCRINPDNMIIFQKKKNYSKKDMKDCILEHTSLCEDVSILICEYVGGFLN